MGTMKITQIDNLNWHVSIDNDPKGVIDFDPEHGDYVAMKSDYNIYGIKKTLQEAADCLSCGWK